MPRPFFALSASTMVLALHFFVLPLWARQSLDVQTYLPHLTREGAGFSSKILIENTGDQIGAYQLSGYDEHGNLQGTVDGNLGAGQVFSAAPGHWFGNASVSHVRVRKADGNLQFSVVFQAAVGSSAPALARETSSNASRYRLFPGNWNEIFDGFAAVNLGDAAARITVSQYTFEGELIALTVAAQSLSEKGKVLYLVGAPDQQPFQALENSYFEVESDQPLALVVLRGDLPQARFLWQNDASPLLPRTIDPGTPIEINVVANPNDRDPVFNRFAKMVDVFGVRLYADSGVSDDKLRHAANIMAAYLDNDEDGTVDDNLVIEQMLHREATLVIFPDPDGSAAESFFDSLSDDVADNTSLQDLYAEEIFPNGAAQGRFDATLEEVLHLITHGGHHYAYPSVFGEMPGSQVAQAMDLARGGFFQSVPNTYPDGAWYTYDDTTCDYACQITEYIYWSLTSLLGAQDFPGRAMEIEHEWRLNTPQSFQSGDPTMYGILSNSLYKMPTVLPDGSYGR